MTTELKFTGPEEMEFWSETYRTTLAALISGPRDWCEEGKPGKIELRSEWCAMAAQFADNSLEELRKRYPEGGY